MQSIDCQWSGEYEKLTNLAVSLQKLAKLNNITIFSLSQVNNASQWKQDQIILKWSGSLFANSDVVLWIYKDWVWQTKIKIIKNKFWPNYIAFDMNINFKTWEVSILEEIDTLPLNY